MITSWSHDAQAGAGRRRSSRCTPEPGTQRFIVVGHSDSAPLPPGVVSSHPTAFRSTPATRLGSPDGRSLDPLHLYRAGPATSRRRVGRATTDSARHFRPRSKRVNISAVVEPDVDDDGYGDESQDNCPTVSNPGQDDVDGDGDR